MNILTDVILLSLYLMLLNQGYTLLLFVFCPTGSILHDSGVAILKSEKKTAGPFPVLSRVSRKLVVG